MRQLRAGESGFFVSYLLAFLCLFPTVSFAESTTQAAHSSQFESSAKRQNLDPLSTEYRDVALVAPHRGNPSGSGAIRSRSVAVRNLNDYEVEDIVLVATVAGQLSALDRKMGQERWKILSEDVAVQTINHHKNGTSGEEEEHPGTWIVEPSENGQLYFYTATAGMERIGVTVKDIINSAPYRIPGSDMIYNGAKNTTVYAINARTGVIEKVFSMGDVSGEMENKKCKTMSRSTTRLPDFDDECDPTEVSDKIFMMGRTEYTIVMQNWKTGKLLWTIKFIEWSPNNSDMDLRAQHQRPIDNRVIYSSHDGTIFGFDDADATGMTPPKYHATLESPVVRVFDVVRPLHNEGSDDLLVLPQPPIRIKQDEMASSSMNDVYVGHIEYGGLYALSEVNFPYVTRRADDARCYKDRSAWKTLATPEREKSLVGIHKLHYSEPTPRRHHPALPAPPSYESAGILSRDPVPDNSAVLDSDDSTFSLRSMLSIAISMVLLGALAITLLFHQTAENYYNTIAPKALRSSIFRTKFPEGLSISQEETITERPTTNLPPKLPEDETAVEQAILEPKAQLDQNQPPNGVVDDSTKLPIVRFIEPEPEHRANEVTPNVNEGENGNETAPVTPKKKKYQRGRRGGKKKSKEGANGANADGDLSTPEEGKPAVERISPVGGAKEEDDDNALTAVSSGGLQETSTGQAFVLNNLKIMEKEIIGSGSHGTTVHRGFWEGRTVAVKRILTNYAEIAMKEVQALQESDYHENIVRYFCQQQQGCFLYIALELCPGSLFDVITKPANYPDLVDLMDVRDTIFQITNGVNHLHSLKIVHRDIKPQNILVGNPKHRSTRPRLLISDFGLCKKLQMDEYSFGATTAHNAGTIGWRAPELLQDFVTIGSGSTAANENSGSGTGHSGTDIVVDSLTKRRATRAIDIFAFGCVCFFVLSRGNHPFGERFSREYNIVHNIINMAPLDPYDDVGLEARDLVARTIRQNPKERPDTAEIGAHPFFWDAEKRLDFLVTASDRFEIEKESEKRDQSYKSQLILLLEQQAENVMGKSWIDKLDPVMHAELFEAKRRGYDGSRMVDLLRAIRNKKNHFLDMSIAAQRVVGEVPDQYLDYWTSRYEALLMHVYRIVKENGLVKEPMFRKYFANPWENQ